MRSCSTQNAITRPSFESGFRSGVVPYATKMLTEGPGQGIQNATQYFNVKGLGILCSRESPGPQASMSAPISVARLTLSHDVCSEAT